MHDAPPARALVPFDAPRVIRCRGAIHLYSAAGLRPDRRSLVLLAALDTAPSEAVRILDAIERAHAAAAGELFAAPLARGSREGREFLALDADAAFDGERMVQALAESGRLVPYAASMGQLLRVADGLAHAHALKTPGPLVVGTLLPCQFIYDSEGRSTLLGLGDPSIARAAPPGMLIAPELQFRKAPDPRTDGFAIAAMMRSMASFTDLPPVLERVLRGAERGTERVLARHVRAFQSRMWSGPPRLRLGPARLASLVRMLCRALFVQPDARAFDCFVTSLMAPESPTSPEAPTHLLRVADDLGWFEIDGGPRCRLASRASLRRLLTVLVDQHRDRPGAVLAPDLLLAAGWPGERVLPEAGLHRVHVALSELRRMGLRCALERFDAGYRFDPALAVQRVAI